MLNNSFGQLVARYNVRNEGMTDVGSHTVDGSPIRYRNVIRNDIALREDSGRQVQETIRGTKGGECSRVLIVRRTILRK